MGDEDTNPLFEHWRTLENMCNEVLDQARPLLTEAEAREVDHFIQSNEFGIAAELMKDLLRDHSASVNEETQTKLAHLFQAMNLDFPRSPDSQRDHS